MNPINPQTIAKEDRIQKTWIPEGTQEYKFFKHITQENLFLAKLLKEKVSLKEGDLILDVGGREGDISIAIQNPKFIHVVDPDPTLDSQLRFGKFIRAKIQDIDLSEFRYKLIICSHVLGYLGNQAVQKEVVEKLVKLLDSDGLLVLFYNTNTRYMSELLGFSKEHKMHGHYDYFDETILEKYKTPEFKITHQDVSFKLDYESYEDLARCCWFLFGAMNQNIPEVAAQFILKLRKDLSEPKFDIEERITFIKRVTD